MTSLQDSVAYDIGENRYTVANDTGRMVIRLSAACWVVCHCWTVVCRRADSAR